MPPKSITLTYDPFHLPTTQHRAGLAGLVLLIDTMRRRRMPNIPPAPRILPDGRVQIDVTLKTLTALFNELYDASVEEQRQKNRRSNGKPMRVDREKDANGRVMKWFVYPQTVPRARFFESGMGMPKIWTKLWADAIWGTLRGIPQTRIPYEERARKKDVSEAGKLWKRLEKPSKVGGPGKFPTTEVTSALLLGGQAKTADNIPVVGPIDENLLLHFWPVASAVFQAVALEYDGKQKYAGFVFAIPDVADLKDFVDAFPAAIANLPPEKAGYRPAASLISVPHEGGLEFARNVIGVASKKVERRTPFSIRSVEVYHVEKVGNNVRILASDRLLLTDAIFKGYEAIRRRYQNPIFRRRLILNLLSRNDWFHGFDRDFASLPKELFFGNEISAKSFRTDAKQKFSEALKGDRT